jgi:hypothetical protein
VCLFGIAARRDCPFHPPPGLPQVATRLCCSDPHLVPLARANGFQWTAVSCYAALRSPDVPPVRCFHPTRTSAFRLAPAAVWRILCTGVAPGVTAINLGRWSPSGSVLPTRTQPGGPGSGVAANCGSRVCLFGIAARRDTNTLEIYI